jgi:hypothetical protein
MAQAVGPPVADVTTPYALHASWLLQRASQPGWSLIVTGPSTMATPYDCPSATKSVVQEGDEAGAELETLAELEASTDELAEADADELSEELMTMLDESIDELELSDELGGFETTDEDAAPAPQAIAALAPLFAVTEV